jgi:hypothetical protein
MWACERVMLARFHPGGGKAVSRELVHDTTPEKFRLICITIALFAYKLIIIKTSSIRGSKRDA